ncbi:hypothetical protein [Phormidesmis priestleyi]|nr:hypothetical protein [Phormidesmis priestleyi]
MNAFQGFGGRKIEVEILCGDRQAIVEGSVFPLTGMEGWGTLKAPVF